LVKAADSAPKALIAHWNSDDETGGDVQQFYGYYSGDLLAASAVAKNKFYFDSGCSFTMVNSLAFLRPSSVQKLPKPMAVGGIAESVVYATYVCSLLRFPSPYDVVYFSDGIGVNLYSLGSFADCGGSYSCVNKVLTLTCGDGSILCSVLQCPYSMYVWFLRIYCFMVVWKRVPIIWG
jgi:hypothetical protein